VASATETRGYTAFPEADLLASCRNFQCRRIKYGNVHKIRDGTIRAREIFLQRWARDHGIRFKLFNPSTAVRKQLKMVSDLAEFEIPTLDEMMALLGQADIQYAMVAQVRF
jgi:hypothetical protein